jgi:hypothetical protein
MRSNNPIDSSAVLMTGMHRQVRLRTGKASPWRRDHDTGTFAFYYPLTSQLRKHEIDMWHESHVNRIDQHCPKKRNERADIVRATRSFERLSSFATGIGPRWRLLIIAGVAPHDPGAIAVPVLR